MKLLLISASPHKAKSRTFQLAQEVLRGASDKTTKSVIIHLCDYRINFCRHSEQCHKKIMNCVIKDDVALILKKMLAADGIILASPNYINQVTGSMKTLFDRASHFIHCKRLLDKYVVAVVSSGGGHDKDVLEYIKYYGNTCGAQYSGGVSSGVPLCKDKLKQTYILGKKLAADIKSKTNYPDQKKFIAAGIRYFAPIIEKRKNDWKQEYQYWKKKGWLA
jgi:multimeric flavodoxin WrbA